ncbi:MAG TPA: DUF3572 family protein [Polymorphobacter sp.]|nr:DUF3572 family protein [Polymorphobacter sp.]
MRSSEIVKAGSAADSETLALQALAYIVGDTALGPRFLDLTGLDAAGLRAHAGERHVLAAALAFLEGHEPSLLAAAAALDIMPAAIVAASAQLGN